MARSEAHVRPLPSAPEGTGPDQRRSPEHGGHGHAHGHGHGHGHGAARSASGRALRWAVVLTVTFMGVEVAVGLYSGSLALLADAAHMLADAAALGLALFAQAWAARPGGEQSTFGYRRAEVLAAFVNGIALTVTALWIVTEAIERWVEPKPIKAVGMLAAAGAGLIINLVVAWILSGARSESVNIRAAFAHVAMDALGSVAALTAGLCVLVFGWMRADPLLSVLISVLVAYSGWRVLKETTGILLESAPPHLDVAAIEQAIVECDGVASIHDLHVWRIADRFDTLTVHVTLERGAHGVAVCQEVNRKLHDEFGLEHITVQPEAPPPDEVVPLRLSRDGSPTEGH